MSDTHKRIAELEAERDLLERLNKRAQDDLMRQSAEILGLKAERDQLAAQVRDYKSELERHFVDRVNHCREVGGAKVQVELARKSLESALLQIEYLEEKANYETGYGLVLGRRRDS